MTGYPCQSYDTRSQINQNNNQESVLIVSNTIICLTISNNATNLEIHMTCILCGHNNDNDKCISSKSQFQDLLSLSALLS